MIQEKKKRKERREITEPKTKSKKWKTRERQTDDKMGEILGRGDHDLLNEISGDGGRGSISPHHALVHLHQVLLLHSNQKPLYPSPLLYSSQLQQTPSFSFLPSASSSLSLHFLSLCRWKEREEQERFLSGFLGGFGRWWEEEGFGWPSPPFALLVGFGVEFFKKRVNQLQRFSLQFFFLQFWWQSLI